MKKSCGIELFPTLHNAALQVNDRLNSYSRDAAYHCPPPSLQFINGNFLHANFKDATLIFINATAYFGPTWLALNECLAQLPTPTTVITTSKKLQAPAFSVVKSTWVDMSWGRVQAYIHTNQVL